MLPPPLDGHEWGDAEPVPEAAKEAHREYHDAAVAEMARRDEAEDRIRELCDAACKAISEAVNKAFFIYDAPEGVIRRAVRKPASNQPEWAAQLERDIINGKAGTQ